MAFALVVALGTTTTVACSNDPLSLAKTAAAKEGQDARPRTAEVESTPRRERPSPHRTKLDHAELYLSEDFAPRNGRYDLIVHFHGMPKLQEKNLQIAGVNAALVSVNYGVGTDVYGSAFRDPDAFDRLLGATTEAIAHSGRAEGASLGRIALSAWSAGFVSVSRILSNPRDLARVDAVLLADGFFTAYADVKKKVIAEANLGKWVELEAAAAQGDKLFTITHTAIPTSGYPSVEETVGKLLDLTACTKESSNTAGPAGMRGTYVVDRGSFHVKGYAGVLAGDHVKQLQNMGETSWRYLEERWEESDAARANRAQEPAR